jgi:hypothetical protein
VEAPKASFISARIRAMSSNDERFVMPLYSAAEAARHLDVPASTFRTWAHSYRNSPRGRPPVVGDPIVTTVPIDRGASIPFIGLAEGYVLDAIRRAGVPLQRIRPALDRLRDELGIEHVLASRKLFTDGAEVLYDYAEHEGDTPKLEALVSLSLFATTSECSTRSLTRTYSASTSTTTRGHESSISRSIARPTSLSIKNGVSEHRSLPMGEYDWKPCSLPSSGERGSMS